MPQPRITDVKLEVDLYPDEPRAVTRGSYVIQNRTGEPLDDVHVRWIAPLQMTKLDVEGATLAEEHVDHDYRIYRFDRAAGAGRDAPHPFETLREQRGFRNTGNEHRIVDNGTFLDNDEIAPMLGMGRNGLLQDRAKRRKYGLPAELRPAKLEDEGARSFNDLRHDSDWVNADITVSTTADQIADRAGLPGVRRRSADGRRTIRYRSDAPINNFFSVQSARYEVAQGPLEGRRAGRLLRPRARATTCERMHAAMKASLDYFTAQLQPVPVPPGAHPRVPGLRAASRSRSPTPSRTRRASASSPTTAIPRRSTWSPTSRRTRSGTSGGRTR